MAAESSLPAWVAEAARLPVAFAQVREDPWIDAQVVSRLDPHSRILMVASGGCTVAYLAATFPTVRIDVVDPNSAQIALAKLKHELLKRFGTEQRLTLLGHAPMLAAERERQLEDVLGEIGLTPDSIGPRDVWAADGPDFAGRYERVFAALRRELAPFTGEIASLLSLWDIAEQARRVSPDCELGRALDTAFDRAMDLPILVQLFGEGATQNRVESFARHFARRTRVALASLPAADNPYLWQVLVGRYPPKTSAPWIAAARPFSVPKVHWNKALMADILRSARAEYDFVHLSNILDWLTPQEASETLNLVSDALRPGGWTLIRQLNSTLDVPASGPAFDWQMNDAQNLHAKDRSYFYRALHLGRKR